MAGVTGLRPQTNDPPGPLDHKPTCTDQNLHKESHVTTKISDKPTVPYVRDSMCKLSVDNDEHNDEETVKTANSSTFNTESTIETDILYENEDDEKSRTSGDHAWIPVTHKTTKRKQSVLTATASEENETPVKTLIKNRGDKMIDTTETLITPVKIEFVLTEKKSCNLRSEFLKLFQSMQNVDPTLAILTDNSAWFNVNDFPVDDTFMKAFKVAQKKCTKKSAGSYDVCHFW